MIDRRRVLGALALPAVAPACARRFEPALLVRPLEVSAALAARPGTPEELASDEDFWFQVGQAFQVDRSIVNLNNGGVCPSPRAVIEAMKRYIDQSNLAPAYTMWQELEPRREGVRARLAAEWGVEAEELALTRNASESLQICQLGLDLARGDEVLTTTQDYPRMIQTFRQRERRDGIALRQIVIPTPCEDPAEIVRRFEAAITERTKLILCCHVINITGQVLPVRELVALGRARGIPVIVDGAHALAHLDFRIGDLDCDYYGVSLHKWLFAPHGTGLLYVRRDRIRSLWALTPAPESMDADIRKFEEIGTHPAANALAIGEALTFHQGIGGARKYARLVWLRDRWARRLLANERVRLHTSLAPGMASGVATVQVEGLDTARLQSWLWSKKRIFTVAILHEEFQGLRISPSVYTTTEELDRFCDAMELAIAEGLPA